MITKKGIDVSLLFLPNVIQMIPDLVLFSYFFAWYLLIAVAILFAISGIDDLFFDAYYWLRYIWRLWKTRQYEPLTYEKLKTIDEKKIAVLLPCWQEDNVIGTMLAHNCYAIEYNEYDIFVGVYPNDPKTIAAVKRAEKNSAHVHCVIGNSPGPTNKASNLNQIFKYIKQYELDTKSYYDIFVFHDSEDIIHPLSFSLYNYLIPRKDMIQLPIFPLEVNYFHFTHWLYNDEFCENHTKDIIVRESIKGLVPSAGVGTAFSRRVLDELSQDNHGDPFATYSLTEDYKTSLVVCLKGLKQIFVSRYILRTKWRRRWLFWGKYRKVQVKEYIATRALFPMNYMKAVRQKARWITGICIQEWIQTGWIGNLSTKYTLLHDRKAVVTHFINMSGYVIFAYWLLYYALTHDLPGFPSLQEQLNMYPWVWYLILFVTFVMMERIFQRFIATTRVYGWIPAFLSIPRVIYGNFLNLHALLRAYRLYFFSRNRKNSKTPLWDKTEHHFPGSHILIPYKRKLGELLLQHHYITEEQLQKAIYEQQETGEQLGDILQKHQFINASQLMEVLARQYQLPLVNLSEMSHLPYKHIKQGISLYNYLWLIHYQAYPISYDFIGKTITIAISDPSNERLIHEVMRHTRPYTVTFVLYDPFKGYLKSKEPEDSGIVYDTKT